MDAITRIIDCQLKAFLGMIMVGDGNVEERRMSSRSSLLEQRLVGRDGESERLIQWLMNLMIQSFVHEPKVIDYFQLRMWVSVCQNFNVVGD